MAAKKILTQNLPIALRPIAHYINGSHNRQIEGAYKLVDNLTDIRSEKRCVLGTSVSDVCN